MSDDFGSFKFLTGDRNYTDYGGKWCRKVAPHRYHVIELMNWVEAVGERDAADMPKYNVSLCEVDLNLIDPHGALQSSGYAIDEAGNIVQPYDGRMIAERDSTHYELVLVECCHGHGNKAPLSEESGNNYRKLMREAIKLSRELDSEWKHSDAMERPVNAICTSAQNYMIGHLGFRDDYHAYRLIAIESGETRLESSPSFLTPAHASEWMQANIASGSAPLAFKLVRVEIIRAEYHALTETLESASEIAS